MRVKECNPSGLLKAIVYIDLVRLDEDAARKTLLAGIHSTRAKPSTSPHFPGTAQGTRKQSPNFPKEQEQIARQKAKEEYISAGLAHKKARRYADALTAYNHALEIDPRDPYTYGKRADVYREMRMYKESLEDFERAFELDARSATAWAYATRGRVYCEMKEYQKACDDFDRAYQMTPKDWWVNKWRDEAYKARNNDG